MPDMLIQDAERTLRSWLPWRRRAAVRALRRVRDPKAVASLIPLLAHPDQAARVAVFTSLIAIGKPAVRPLTDALGDESAGVRWGAAWVLGQLGLRKMAMAVMDALQGNPEAATRDNRAARPLARALHHRDLRRPASEALARMGRSAVGALCRVLHGPGPDARAAAAWALGEIGGERAADALAEAVRTDPDPEAQEAAVRALGRLGTEGIGRLVQTLPDPRTPWRLVAETLGSQGSVAVHPLLGALQSPDALTCRGAALALGFAGDPQAVEPLVGKLEDEAPVVREAAGEALGLLGAAAARALPILRRGREASWREAVSRIEEALRSAPAELEASAPPTGRGTELESGLPPGSHV